jgi:drug/metabolite transporter (DMT)-like permease
MGLANAAAQYLWTRALHAAPATAVSPFYYFLLVWSLVIGFLVWGDVPTPSLLIGSGIVVASGLFLLYNEAQRAAAGKASDAASPKLVAAEAVAPDAITPEPAAARNV